MGPDVGPERGLKAELRVTGLLPSSMIESLRGDLVGVSGGLGASWRRDGLVHCDFAADSNSGGGAFRFLEFFGCVGALFSGPSVVVERVAAVRGAILTVCGSGVLFRGLFTAANTPISRCVQGWRDSILESGGEEMASGK
jgi:hypothetical protein